MGLTEVVCSSIATTSLTPAGPRQIEPPASISPHHAACYLWQIPVFCQLVFFVLGTLVFVELKRPNLRLQFLYLLFNFPPPALVLPPSANTIASFTVTYQSIDLSLRSLGWPLKRRASPLMEKLAQPFKGSPLVTRRSAR